MGEQAAGTTPHPQDSSAPGAGSAGGGTALDRHRKRRLAAIIAKLSALAVVILVVLGFSRYYIPQLGLTYVLDFGDQLPLTPLPEVAQTPHYVHKGAVGYDACFYAQLALRPAANDPALATAIDNAPYRARRIMLPWIAWALGFGDPARVFNVFAALNLVAWLALAALITRWLPLDGAGNLLRWCGVMLSAGALSSLSHALTDLPALAATAGSVAFLQSGRPRSAILAGAFAGLTRETSVLSFAIFAPEKFGDRRGWLVAIARGALALAPLALWLAYLASVWAARTQDAAGFSILALPFSGFVQRWKDLIGIVVAEGGWRESSGTTLLFHFAITVQAVWMIVRPRWSSPWWRIGAAHVLLLALLGPRAWEGYPGASARVLLPLMLAFNVVVPRTPRFLLVLLAGNLTIFAGLVEFRPPTPPLAFVHGPAELVNAPGSGEPVAVVFGNGFYITESQGSWVWRWTSGPAEFRISNPHDFPIRVRMRFALRAGAPRDVELRSGDERLWSGIVGDKRLFPDLPPLVIPPGGRVVEVVTGQPDPPPPGHNRALAVRLYNMDVAVERAPP